ncbi:MAG: MarC family protein [Methanomassiliicoccales archaeon]
MSWEFAITAFAAIFAIVNPIGNIPFFVTVTEGYTKEEKHRVIVKICIVMLAVLFAFGIFGQYIFMLYGITIPMFKIAGGLLLFSVAFAMMRGERSRAKITEDERQEALAKEEIGVVPLGIPLFAGPGAITTVMIYISYAMDSPDMIFDLASVFISILATAAISYVLLIYSQPIFERMGRGGAAAFGRIMGLLLAAVAVGFIMNGVFDAVTLYIERAPWT